MGINKGRVLAGGLLAGVVWTVLSSILTVVAGAAFAGAVPGNRLASPPAGLVALLFAVNVAEGLWAVWLYAAIRPRFGAGPRTAAIVGVSWWILSTAIDVTWGSFGFVAASALVGPIVGALPAQVLASLAGAWFYRE